MKIDSVNFYVLCSKIEGGKAIWFKKVFENLVNLSYF